MHSIFYAGQSPATGKRFSIQRWRGTTVPAIEMAKTKRDENKWNRFCVVARKEIFIWILDDGTKSPSFSIFYFQSHNTFAHMPNAVVIFRTLYLAVEMEKKVSFFAMNTDGGCSKATATATAKVREIEMESTKKNSRWKWQTPWKIG